MIKIRLKAIIISSLIGLVMILAYLLIIKVQVSSSIRVLYSPEKIRSVKIVLNTSIGEYEDSKVLYKDVKNGRDYKLNHDSDLDIGEFYVVEYKGVGDYAGGFVKIDSMKKHNIIEITPNYKDSVNDKLITRHKDSIYKALSNEFPNIHLYKVDKGGMLNDGRWYYTKLTYQGGDYSKSDTLRVVLEYKNNSWFIATEPDLVVTQANNPNVPFEVLSKANNYDTSINF